MAASRPRYSPSSARRSAAALSSSIARSTSVVEAATPATSRPSGLARTGSGSVAYRRPTPEKADRTCARVPVRSMARSSSWAPAATSRSVAWRRSRVASARPALRCTSRRSRGSSCSDSESDHTGWMAYQPCSSQVTSGSRAISAPRWMSSPSTTSIRRWSAPPSAATVATTRRSPSDSAAMTSSARKSSIEVRAPAVRSSARAGHPPRSARRSRGRPRRAANSASSSSPKARSRSRRLST
jgi:hypothetical protein